jgi:8-oxo-dGTP diphosphatase
LELLQKLEELGRRCADESGKSPRRQERQRPPRPHEALGTTGAPPDYTETSACMPQSSKLFAVRDGRVLLVRRRKDGLWTFPGGKRKKSHERPKGCLRRELREELPALRLGRIKLWRKMKGRNPLTGSRLNLAIFIAGHVEGDLIIGDEREIDRAGYYEPNSVPLSPTTRYIHDRIVSTMAI